MKNNKKPNSFNEKIADKTIKYGLLSLLAFFAIFAAFAFFMPLNSAVIADGVVVLDFNRKTIQHLEGGIVEKIFVKEGDFVQENQPLIALNDIKSKSDKNSLLAKLWSMKLQKTRLIAEKNDEKEINIASFLQEINEKENQVLHEIIATQKELFKAREGKSQGEIAMFYKKLTELKNKEKLLIKQRKSSYQKMSLISKELQIINPLVAENNLPITQKLDLEKQLSDAKNQNSSYKIELDKTRQEIVQTKLQITNYENEDLTKILDEIKQTEVEIVGLANEIGKVRDIETRSIITTPVAGNVMDIKYHTIGAVVQPASEIMTIIPQNDRTVIEAKIRPQDIDSIIKNQEAQISLTAYKEKKVPKLKGRVINISGDILSDPQTKETYYIARVEIDESEVVRLKNEIEITPGMPAQVFIIKGPRSLIDYLTSPIKDSAYKAFREE